MHASLPTHVLYSRDTRHDWQLASATGVQSALAVWPTPHCVTMVQAMFPALALKVPPVHGAQIMPPVVAKGAGACPALHTQPSTEAEAAYCVVMFTPQAMQLGAVDGR
jgi:hypothetical protein